MPASERSVRVGVVVLPQQRWAEAAPRWRAVEAMGFDHVWTYDHLAWQSLADEPWFATVPTLTAAATVTERIALGTWVASPNYRHPVPFAKEVMGLDDVSGGRFVLGVGAGGTGWDARVLGRAEPTPRERVDRLEEFVSLLDLLLTQPSTTWRGRWFEAVEARMAPGPLGQDAWWQGIERLSRRFDEALDCAGRDVGSVRRYLNLDSGAVFSLSSAEVFADALGRAASLGFTDVVTHWPREQGVYAGDEAVLEQVAAALA